MTAGRKGPQVTGHIVGDQRMEKYNQMKQILDSVAEDMEKAQSGNKAAGTRVRSAMQDIKNLAQELRKDVLEMRKQE
ncbi:MAG: histone H1 [Phycisphaerales bacterium]